MSLASFCRRFVGSPRSRRFQVTRRAVAKVARKLARDAYRAEALEPRKLLATVAGTLGADTFTIDIVGANIVVNRNGTPFTFSDAAETTIIINADSGADTISILRNGLNTVTINGGAGNDTINLGNTSFDSTINANVLVNGGADVDSLVVDDSLDTAGSDSSTINDTTFKKVAAETLSWGSGVELVENVLVNLGANPELVVVDGTQTGTALVVNAGDGNDTLQVGDRNVGADLNDYGSSFTLNGGIGVDSIFFDDADDIVADTYTINAGTITKTSTPVVVSYSSISSMTVDAGAGFNNGAGADVIAQTFNIFDTAVSLTINAAAGNDTLNYGDGVVNTNLIDSPVTFNGDAGTDAINYNGQTVTLVTAYTVTSTAITSTQNGALNYATSEALVLNGSTLVETYTVNSLLTGTPATINAGDGDDSITAGGGDIDSNLFAAVSVVGGAGNDSLTADDTADGVGSDTYFIGGGSIVKGGLTRIFWGTSLPTTIDRVRINGSSQTNTWTVPSVLLSAAVTVNGGTGADTYAIGSGTFNASFDNNFTLFDVGGVDTATIDDTATATATTYTFGVGNTLSSPTMGGTHFFSSNLEGLTFNASTAVQTFNVNSIVGYPLTLNASDGNDTLNLGGDNWASNFSLADVTFNGGIGTDRINVNDTADSIDDDETYTFNGSSLVKADTGGDDLFWSATEHLVVNGAPFGSAYGVALNGIPVGLSVTINAGVGNDTLDASTSDDIDNSISGTLAFFAFGGTDRLDLNDTGDSADNENYTLSATTFDKTAATFGGLGHFEVEQISLTGNGGNNTISLQPLNTGQAVTIGGGTGDDTFNPVSNWNENFRNCTVLFTGGAGTGDLLNWTDAPDAEVLLYSLNGNTLSAGTFGGGGPFTFSYDLIETVNLTLNNIASTLNMTGLDGETVNFNLNMGNGNDTVNVNTDLDDAPDAGLANRTSLNFAGGADTDTFNVTDLDNEVGNDAYFLNSTQLIKDVVVDIVLLHTGMEAITLTGSSTLASTYNLDATHVPTTVTGGTGADSFDIVGGDDGTGPGTFTINGGDGNDTLDAGGNLSAGGLFVGGVGTDSLNYDDSLGTPSIATPIEYGNSGLVRAGNPTLDFDSTLERFSYQGNSSAHTYNILKNKAGSATINGGDGNDTFNAGGGDIDLNLFNNVTLAGEAGTDRINFEDTADDFLSDSLSISSGSINKGGQIVTYNTFETQVFNGSPQATTYNVNVVAIPTTINAGDANDTLFLGDTAGSVNVGAGDLTANLVVNAGIGADSITIGNGDIDEWQNASVTVNGGAGNDTVRVNDTADTGGAATYNVNGTIFTRTNTATNFLGADIGSATIIIDANASANIINFTAAGGTGVINGNNGIDDIHVFEGAVTLHSGAGLDSLDVNEDETGTASVTFDQNDDLGLVRYYEFSSGGIVPNGNLVVDMNNFTTIRGTFDVANNLLVTRITTQSFLLDKITRGYNGGTWNGVPGPVPSGVIRSSTAAGSVVSDGIGYARIGGGVGELNVAVFRGVPVAVGNVVMLYTLNGDANLDRTVNFDDLLTLSQNYGTVAGKNWLQGNSNYDSFTNFDDLLSLSQNYNQSVLQASPAASLVAAPATTTKRSKASQIVG